MLRACLLVFVLAAFGCDGMVILEPTGDAGTFRRDGGPSCAEGVCVLDPFALLADPYLPARALPGRSYLASSRFPEPRSGTGNDDFTNFVRIEPDGARILMEADGPGMITRLWFTGRQPAGQIYEVIDQTIFHIAIDGTEVEWVEGESGVSIGTLTSGALPGFSLPWVAGREDATNAFLVHVPIAFAESIRVWIDEPPGTDTLFFYQIDWRRLPADVVVESFDGTLDDTQIGALDAATLLWVERSTHAAVAMMSDTRLLGAGANAMVSLNEPTTVRAVWAEAIEGSLDALEGELFVDGVSVVEGPLLRWTFASPPTVPNDSALASVGAGSIALRYPFPVHSAVELRLRNAGDADVRVRFGIDHDPGAPSADLGALRASCGVVPTPAVRQNFRLLDVSGVSGHYAGQFLIIRSAVNGFSGFTVLEGDHELRADDEDLLGTGLEDYFGGSFYYMRSPFVLPLAGASYRSEVDTPTPPVISQYRHHFLDTVPFDGLFQFEYESFLADCEFEYCLFWYEDQ